MSRKDIINIASREDGTKESPPGSNKTKYGQWYGLNGVKWCAIFVSWVYDHAGYPLGFIETTKGYQSCQGGYKFWKTHGQLTKEPQAGDIVLFDWAGDGHCDHTGIFETWADRSKMDFFCWEGNTAVNNDSDGGMVMRRRRSRALVRAFASPVVLENPSPSIITHTLRRGDAGANVTAVQKLLYDLKFPITVDGDFGKETETIVKQYQHNHHLEITGTVSPALKGAMKEEVEQSRIAKKRFTSGSYLRKGNAGAAVIRFQIALNESGIKPKVTVDGVFGNETYKALKLFQRKHRLTVDGIAGPETFVALGIST